MRQVASTRAFRTWRFVGVFLGLIVVSTGCSVSNIVVRRVFDGQPSDSPNVLLTENDPALAEQVLPVVIKTLEAVVLAAPDEPYVAIDAAQAMVLYGLLLESRSMLLQNDDYTASMELAARANNMYSRARHLAIAGFDHLVDEFAAQITLAPYTITAAVEPEHIKALYVLAGAWGLEIASNIQNSDRLAELPVVGALLDRGIELDSDFGHGAWHSFGQTYWLSRGLNAANRERAERHYMRAEALSGGEDLGLYVTRALKVAVADQDVASFRKLLEHVLRAPEPVDVNRRLMNVLAKREARWLLANIEEWFIDVEGEM